MGEMALYVFVRFEPRPGKELQLRDELHRVLEPTRAEPGCLRIHLYESTREPLVWFIHSWWTERFAAAAEPLLIHPIQAVHTRQAG